MDFIRRILGKEIVNTEKTEANNHSSHVFRDNTDDKLLNSGEFIEKRMRGKITRVDPKGFGFITSKEIPYTRIFFHWSGLLQTTRNFKDLDKGMWVEFNPFLIRDKGYRALRIEVVDGPTDESNEGYE